jgi:hypothetical protein
MAMLTFRVDRCLRLRVKLGKVQKMLEKAKLDLAIAEGRLTKVEALDYDVRMNEGTRKYNSYAGIKEKRTPKQETTEV